MAKSHLETLLFQRQLTKSIIDIQDNINKLSRIDTVSYRIPEDFGTALYQYINSSYTLKDYLTFRAAALEVKEAGMRTLDRPDAKQIVGNIVLGILGLGIIYGLAVGINYLLNDKALFFKPEAINRLEAVFNDVDSLKHNPLAATF